MTMPDGRRPPARRMRGFTLVEMMVAVTLLSLTLTAVYAALYTTSRSWAAGEAARAENEHWRLGLDLIRRQISQSIPLLRPTDDGIRVVFRGDETSLRYVAALPAHRGGGGLYYLALQLGRNGTDEGLTLFYEPAFPETEYEDLDREGAERTVLIPGIEAVRFRYYGTRGDEERARWHREWNEERRRPLLVGMQLVRADRAPAPEALVPLHLTEILGMPQFSLSAARPAANRGN